MPSSSGSAELRALAVRLRAVGGGTMLRQTGAAIRAEAKPLAEAAKATAGRELPQSGGLAAYVAGQRITASVRTGANTAGVRLTSRVPVAGTTNNSGFARHPTFGRRGKGQWKVTQTPDAKGWFDQTISEGKPEVAAAIMAVLRRVAAEITGRG